MTIGERMKAARRERKMSQGELAEKTGVSRVSIGFYERDSRTPPADVAVKIANALNVPVAYLLGNHLYKTGGQNMGIPIFQIKGFAASAEDRSRIADDIQRQMREGVVVLDGTCIKFLGVIGDNGTFVPCAQGALSPGNPDGT